MVTTKNNVFHLFSLKLCIFGRRQFSANSLKKLSSIISGIVVLQVAILEKCFNT